MSRVLRARILALTISLSTIGAAIGFSGCDRGNGAGMQIASNDPGQTELPHVEVRLPPPPTFNEEHPQETYSDGTLSVYGLRKNLAGHLDQAVSVKGMVIEVYTCPPCPKGAICKPCIRPHFWLADKKDAMKDQALMVTELPDKTKTASKAAGKTPPIVVGGRLVVSGQFSKNSPGGFASSDGLLIYTSHRLEQSAAGP